MSARLSKRIRFGYGAFGPPHEPRRFAQEAFLDVAKTLYPGIVVDLQRMGITRLDDWGRKWNLRDAWITEVAKISLEVQEEDLQTGEIEDDECFFGFLDPAQAKGLKLGTSRGEAETFPPEDCDWGDPDTCQVELDWDPLFTTDEDFRIKAMDAARLQIEAHIRGRSAAAESAGFVRLTGARAAEHFTWLARYQCGLQKYEEIAAKADKCHVGAVKTRRTNYIRDTVRNVSKVIGLTLRKPDGAPGRPRGSRSKSRSLKSRRSRR